MATAVTIAVRRQYACPVCAESFTKWGLCERHVRSVPCREKLDDQLGDIEALQEKCRAAARTEVAEPPPLLEVRPPEVASAAASVALQTTSTLSSTLTVQQEAKSTLPSSKPAHAGGVAPVPDAGKALRQLEKAIDKGDLSKDELRNPVFEELRSRTAAVQAAALEKFLGANLRCINNKASWLKRCLDFTVRTSRRAFDADLPAESSGMSPMIAALASQALLMEELPHESWDHYKSQPTELQRFIVDAVQRSVLINVTNLSEHFINICRNERVIFELEMGPVPRVDQAPPTLQLESGECAIYQALLCETLTYSEERALRVLTKVTVEPGKPGSLLYIHQAIADQRARGTAEVLSLLHAAAGLGLVRLCARLACEGLDVNERAGDKETTPLHLAAAKCEVEVVRLLLNLRADPNNRDGDGHSPLFCAVSSVIEIQDRAKRKVQQKRLWHTVHNLLMAGALINPEGNLGKLESALDLAKANDMRELRKLIQLHQKLRELRKKFPIDDKALSKLCSLQYETATFVMRLFRHLKVSPEASQTEFHALLTSDFIQARDKLQSYGNRLAWKLGSNFTKKAVDALVELPPAAGVYTLTHFRLRELVHGVFEAPEKLNDPAALAAASREEGITKFSAAEGPRRIEATLAGGPDVEAPRPLLELREPRVQGLIRKWDSERGFGFIVQDPQDGEAKDIFVHRKNIVGSTPNNHLDLKERCRIEYRLGEQDGRPRALEATMLDSDGKIAEMHYAKSDNTERGLGKSKSVLNGDIDDLCNEEDLTRDFILFMRTDGVQTLAKEKRPENESWMRCVGLRRHNAGRRDDSIWKKEIERRVDIFLERGTTPLLKKDFDFRVRRFLHEFCLHNTVTRVSEALAMVETSTAQRPRNDVRSWPAYLATLLRNFDPKLYEILADRDRRSRLDQRRAREGDTESIATETTYTMGTQVVDGSQFTHGSSGSQDGTYSDHSGIEEDPYEGTDMVGWQPSATPLPQASRMKDPPPHQEEPAERVFHFQ